MKVLVIDRDDSGRPVDIYSDSICLQFVSEVLRMTDEKVEELIDYFWRRISSHEICSIISSCMERAKESK